MRNARSLSERFKRLRKVRDKLRETTRGNQRHSLTLGQRKKVLAKTGRTCHICGGKISPRISWEADHVIAFAQGGDHSPDNYLPAHSVCNNYRWYYSPEEFQWILKLGVWWRTQIERENREAMELAERFVRYENRRVQRRVS